MKTLFTLFFLLLFRFCFAQDLPSNNLLLGYQKFPTAITGHAADLLGNQYFTGTFKGELTINDKVTTSGNGLEDVFWAKTDANGQLLKYRTYGSSGSEQSFSNGLVMIENDHMVFGVSIAEPVTFSSITVMPYSTSSASSITGCIVFADTSGNIGWVKRTNLQYFKLFYADSVIHIVANTSPNSPAIKVEENTVMDSTGLSSVVHLMFDKSGKFLSSKIISPRRANQSVSLFTIQSFSDKKLLLGISCFGDSSFNVNNKPVSLPSTLGGYMLLLKTDTSYSNIKTKLLNPLSNLIYFNGYPSLPITVSPQDSIYTIISFESSLPFTSLDGFTQAPQRNVLYVLDSSLTAKRQLVLSNTFAGYYPKAPQRRRLFFRDIAFKNGQLFFNGQFTGINESPMNEIPIKDTIIAIIPGIKLSVDQNGPSRSFIAKCDVSGFNAIAKWYGDHHEYESMFLPLTFFHNAGPNRLSFVHSNDNVWNPWLIDDSLTIVTGAMRKNTDMPEVTQMIRYFNDGSKIVIGYARGRTALDSTGDFITNGLRRDVFLVRLRANNQVAWYKRFYSTLQSSDIRNMEIKNGKAWVLINYNGSENDSNFIKIGADVYDVKVGGSILASVDTTGNLNILNLKDSAFRYFSLTSFDFFSNGDIGALSNTITSIAGFPPATGIAEYVFRVNSATGTVLDKRRLYGSSGVDNIKIDKNDQIYISGSVFSNAPYRLYLHDGTKYIDSISLSATSAALALLKMDWNHLKWQKKFSIAFLSHAELLLNNNKPVLFSPALANQSLSWDGQSIHNGFNSMSLSLVMLDSNGVMIRNKVLPAFLYNYARTGTNGSLYLCGTINQQIKVDTIQLSYGGNNDGVGIVLDSILVAKKSFRIASPYSEALLDMDIFQDSLVTFAYIAQTNPSVYSSKLMANISDYQADAYVGTVTSRVNVVTSTSNSLPAMNDLTIAPNPVTNLDLQMLANVQTSLVSTYSVYQSNGQFITSKTIILIPGQKQYLIHLPVSVKRGIYYVTINNKKWTTTRSFLVQ